MTPLEFAQSYLQPFTLKGSEIVPQLCPICKGGQKRDKQTFALNADKQTYNCKRGSCAVQGHYSELLAEFGIRKNQEYIPTRKVYKPPEKKPQKMQSAAKEYLKLRKISTATAESYRLGTDESGNLLFPYFTQDCQHVFNKFRYPRKLEKSDKKAWRESDTMPVLFGMHLCNPEKPLTIFEGEFDAMSGHEAGIPNCVSVPSGAEDFTWLDTSWDFIQQFDTVYLFGDNDASGHQMIHRLVAKLSDKKVLVVPHPYKDANALLYRSGKDAVRDCWGKAKEVPPAGLLNLADVVPLDVKNIERIRCGIGKLNAMIGGFMYGDVTLWTGRRGEGKSTILSEMCLDAIDDGKKVCAYSGELRADRFQYWVDLQAAGKGYITEFFDHASDRMMYYVKQDIREKIHNWYSGKFWLYDNNISLHDEEQSIISVFETAAKRYDCRVFMVDNLMTAYRGTVDDNSYYRQQSRFVGELVKFASKYGVHVHLVAHPNKAKGGELDNDNVSGSAELTNRVANVIALSRVKESESAQVGYDVTMSILKNRWEGQLGAIGLNYCKVSRRLFVPSDNNTKQFGWEFENWGELPSPAVTGSDGFVEIEDQQIF